VALHFYYSKYYCFEVSVPRRGRDYPAILTWHIYSGGSVKRIEAYYFFLLVTLPLVKIYIMKNLITSFNVLIFAFFTAFSFVTGTLVNSPGDKVVVHYSLLFFFFTIVLTILRAIAKSVQEDIRDEREDNEHTIEVLRRAVNERDK